MSWAANGGGGGGAAAAASLSRIANPLSSPSPHGVTVVSGEVHQAAEDVAYVLSPTGSGDYDVTDAAGVRRYTVVTEGISLHDTTVLYGADGKALLTFGDKWFTGWSVGMVAHPGNASYEPLVELKKGKGPGEKNVVVARWTAAASLLSSSSSSSSAAGDGGGSAGADALRTEHPFLYAASVNPKASVVMVNAVHGEELARIDFGQKSGSPDVLRLGARLDAPLFLATAVLLKRWARKGKLKPVAVPKGGSDGLPPVMRIAARLATISLM